MPRLWRKFGCKTPFTRRGTILEIKNYDARIRVAKTTEEVDRIREEMLPLLEKLGISPMEFFKSGLPPNFK
ncbi:MAG: hypothetical protein ABIH20_03110 [Candidatus Diapherotrites archaeon]